MSPRPYAQQVRAESTAQTRRRILDAVYERLRQAPAERVTVDGVARDAGVSRATIYLVFGDRTGLFDAIGADLLERSGFTEVMRAIDDPDPRAAVDRFLHATTQMYARNHDVLRSLFAMAQIDPTALGGSIARMEDGRRHGMRLLAHRLADEGQLRDDADPVQAVDLLWLMSSFTSFDLLATGHGRTPEQIADTFLATLERSRANAGEAANGPGPACPVSSSTKLTSSWS